MLLTRNIRISSLLIVTLAGIVITFCFAPVPQDLDYHSFADKRTVGDIPNFLNVVSNFFFLLTAAYGFVLLSKSNASTSIKTIYAMMFLGILLTGFGSAYYHLAPDNDTLVFDRIPMTIIFMSFFAATIAERIDIQPGKFLLWPLLLLGIISVLWWSYSEKQGQGDLRFYGLVQFFPVILIPLIYLLYPSPVYKKATRLLIWVVLSYIVAKLFEHFDEEIYSATGFISGHSLKHLFASVATFFMVRMFKVSYA